MDSPIVHTPLGRRTRIAYVAESSIENIASAAAGGVFLTLLLKRLGFSDSLTGIISSLSTLACTAQIFASGATLKTRSVKGFVLRNYVLCHLLTVSLFLLPFITLGQTAKTVTFILFYLGGSVLYNLLYPNKFNWLMSCVPENRHGSFTANRELTMLISGLFFIYPFSAKIDAFNDAGRENASLILICVTVAVFDLLHLFSLLYTADGPNPAAQSQNKSSMWQLWKEALADKRFIKLLPIGVVYTAAVLISTAYFTVYQLQELQFSLKYVATLNIIGAIARALVSRPFGRLADRFGWCRAMTLSFCLFAVAFTFGAHATPANGRVMFLLYVIFNSMANAIAGTGIHTLTFSYVPQARRTTALGIYGSLGGIFGFLGSLLGSVIINAVQGRGGLHLFGTTVYAQQVNSAVTVFLMLCLVLYMLTVIRPMPTLTQLEQQKNLQPAGAVQPEQ